MKKKNLILLIFICILSLCAFTGLLMYAFNLQTQKDLQSASDSNQNRDTSFADSGSNSSAQSKASPAATVPPNPSAVPSMAASVPPGPSAVPSMAASVSAFPSVEPSKVAHVGGPIVLGFAGDVNLDEASYPAQKYDSVDGNIKRCISKDLLEQMKAADIMMLNNEFAYSTRGTKTPDKSYTFRANPSRVELLKKMGVDIVSLANNHALDYGPDALSDTFDTLDAAGIEYAGAGKNLERAVAPIYFKVGDKTIAYVAASRVVFSMDWYASKDKLGMVGTYDPSLILKSIRKAKAKSDYVVIFVHWGVERKEHPEDYQRNLAQQYIDAGADAVVGCHPHVMQGLEFYKGKPIAYSLGNYWFNNSTKKSGMLKLYLGSDNSVKVQLLPAMNKDTYTYLLTEGEEKAAYYDYIEGISYGVHIDADGFISKDQ